MDETAKKDSDIKHLAPSVVHATKSMFIIRVQYYVQIVLCFGMLQRAISVKLPFLLKRTTDPATTENKENNGGNTVGGGGGGSQDKREGKKENSEVKEAALKKREEIVKADCI